MSATRMSGTMVLAMALVGCAGDPPTQQAAAQEQLAGSWYRDTSSTCFEIYDFTDSDYTITGVCDLGDRSKGVEVIAGTYSLAGNEVTFFADHATCADWPKTAGAVVSVTDSQLTLSGAAGVRTFRSVPPSSVGTWALSAGCFKDGAFTSAPFAPL